MKTVAGQDSLLLSVEYFIFHINNTQYNERPMNLPNSAILLTLQTCFLCYTDIQNSLKNCGAKNISW